MPDQKQDVGTLKASVDHLKQMERQALCCYRPATPSQLRVHTSRAYELLVRGGKRSAKSTCCFSEFASRVTGVPIRMNLNTPTWHPTAMDVEMPLKFDVPKPDDPKLYWIVGWDLKHIGQTIYRILFEPGLFRVIKDQETGEWRTWNKAYAPDQKRKNESRAAEPLIPGRLIDQDSWSWDHAAGGRAAKVFREVRLLNGAKICTYPSSAKAPKQGDPVDGLLIDEDIQQPEFLDEYQDRLTDVDGWFMWSVWPHVSNFALVTLLDRAEEDNEGDIEAVQLLMSENPFITNAAKGRALKRMGDDDAIARRDRGELLLGTIQMYDFAPAVHTISKTHPAPPQHIRTKQEVLTAILQQYGALPEDWTRYKSLDPSHTRTAVLYGAVPPPDVLGVQMHPCLVVEDELVLKRASGDTLARESHEKMRGRAYEAFIMDRRIGQQARVGMDGISVFQAYTDAFQRANNVSRLSHSSFIPGIDKPTQRHTAVRKFLSSENGGQPSLFFVLENTILTQKEFNSYRKKQMLIQGERIIVDEPANPRKYDCMAALEYLVAYMDLAFQAGHAYVPGVASVGAGSAAYQFAQNILRGQRAAQESYTHLGAGAGPAA